VRGATTINSSITLAPGNYNINSLLTELSTQLSNHILLLVGAVISFGNSYNKTTGKCTLSMIGVDHVASTLTLKFADNLPLGKFFGFTSNASLNYDTYNYSNSVVANQNCNVNQINHIFIRSSTFQQRESYENVVEKDVYSDVLSKVLINVLPGNYILYEGNGNLSCDVVNKTIDLINIYLSDNLSYTLSLDGLEWNMTLIIQEIGINKAENLLEFKPPPTISNKEQIQSQIEELRKQLDLFDKQNISHSNDAAS